MKTYRIKSQFTSILTGLHGLHITPSESWDYVNVHVFDNQSLSNAGGRNRITSLPRNCDSELVYAVLEQIQFDKATSASVKVLREYLQCAEQKDKNNERKSDIKEALKQIFFGALLFAIGGVGGFALTVLLIGLSPASASWISLLIIPTVVAAVWGVMKAGIGCLKLGIGIFSFCFSPKNIEQLPLLKNELQRCFFEPPPPPPSYQELIENKTIASAPVLYTEPPTYQQAVENITALSTRAITPPIYIPAFVPLPGHTAHFFHHPHAVSNQMVNDNPSPAPVCRHYFN
jgi:hypothetical protein